MLKRKKTIQTERKTGIILKLKEKVGHILHIFLKNLDKNSGMVSLFSPQRKRGMFRQKINKENMNFCLFKELFVILKHISAV